ncbi:MAG: hypothetical protein L3V56_00475 [Candidatus Magnetoovum sp. WYHC-5]|nr:hypothetical protein [Candidatus Magnetoovum sp. WYHC-5]
MEIYAKTPLSTPLTAKALHEYLEKRSGISIKLVLTENLTTMFSFKRSGNVATLRIQKIFLKANTAILDELVHYIMGRQRTIVNIRHFIKMNTIHFLQEKKLKLNLNPIGKHYNLLDIFNILNAQYFSDTVNAQITWGRRQSNNRTKKRTLGLYNIPQNIIRINPILDTPSVPSYVVHYIVYHEMLHCHVGFIQRNTKRLYHTSTFRQKERLFQDYQKAVAFLEKF